VGYAYTVRSLVTVGVSGGFQWWLQKKQSGQTSYWQEQDEWLHLGGDVGIRMSPQVELAAHFGWVTQEVSPSAGSPFLSVGTSVAF
jgi:hypothetical protein